MDTVYDAANEKCGPCIVDEIDVDGLKMPSAKFKVSKA